MFDYQNFECRSLVNEIFLISGRGTPADDKDLNLDEVYEKISDDELDFFDEENSKSKKPAPLDELDWSALAAIKPASKRGTINFIDNCFFPEPFEMRNLLIHLRFHLGLLRGVFHCL